MIKHIIIVKMKTRRRERVRLGGAEVGGEENKQEDDSDGHFSALW